MRIEPVPYFLAGAKWASMRGDCSRRQVGAILTTGPHPNRAKAWRVFGVGYNGSYPGGPSCLEGLCPRAQSNVLPGSSYDDGPGYCIATHAEANCLLDADRSRIDIYSVLFISEQPCTGCVKLIRAAGIRKVYWPDGNHDWRFEQ